MPGIRYIGRTLLNMMNMTGSNSTVTAFMLPTSDEILRIAAYTLFGLVVFGSLLFGSIWEDCLLLFRRRKEQQQLANNSVHVPRQVERVTDLVADLALPDSHGIEHACNVFFHAVLALEKYVDHPGMARITSDDKLAVLLAALLHDVDDHKYFPNHNNFENARAIMDNVKIAPGVHDATIRMIGYVSCSKNRDNIPDEAKLSPWVLIPRHGDRLEAMGWVGIVRAWEYSDETKNRLWNLGTLRATTKKELWDIAKPARYKLYSATGRSKSLIDHFYDKLLHLHLAPMRNEYFDNEKMLRVKPMVNFCLNFGRANKIKRGSLKFARGKSKVEARKLMDRVNDMVQKPGSDGEISMSKELREVVLCVLDRI